MNEFIRVASTKEVPDPGKTLVEVDGDMVALFHVNNHFYAIDDVCTHDGGPLADGELRDYTIACPRHGAKFDIRTGSALTMPAVRPTRAHRVKVEDESVWVQLCEGTSTSEEVSKSYSSHTSVQSSSKQTPLQPSAPNAPVPSPISEESQLSEDLIREMLKEVKDPELFVNIVDLGLIYAASHEPVSDDSEKQKISIDMTMTSPACPAGPQLISDAKRVLSSHPYVEEVEVRIVMDPPWSPDKMTEAARDQLGIF